MKKIVLLFVSLFIWSCAVPYIKLSDEISVRHLIWSSKFFYSVETNIKNTCQDMLDLKIICAVGGENKVYNIKVRPGEVAEIKERVPRPVGGGISFNCEFYKR